MKDVGYEKELFFERSEQALKELDNEVVVHYNGDIAESDPLQINTVYAITLKTPANRETE